MSSFAFFQKLLELPCDFVVKKSNDPRVFGPDMWRTIHRIADNYPEDPSLVQKESMRSFIMALSDLIPCHSCGLCFRKYLDMPTIDLCEAVSSRENCIKFFVDAHNYVNNRLDKPEMNVEEATILHESSYVNTNGKNTSAKCS